jgi:thiol-disulfide isomerase/thioredoxin
VSLLFFALAGQRMAERVRGFRRRERKIRAAAGMVTILLAAALVFNLPAALQRIVPDYTGSLQDKLAGDRGIGEKLTLGGLANDQNGQLPNCGNGNDRLENCDPAPDLKDIAAWLNTPDDKPIDLQSLRGGVVLVDFWAYSCINCQRAIQHVVGWYQAYHQSRFEVIGVHTPEYTFEKVGNNVKKGAADLGITYPIALDNGYSTWANYRNRYWPAEYLIDANGTVRHIKFGEGDYRGTEKLLRQLLVEAHPGAELPPPVEVPDTTRSADSPPRHTSAQAKH